MSLYNAMLARFTHTGLDVEEHRDESWLETPGFGDNGVWRLIGQAYEDRSVIVIQSRLKGSLPEGRRTELALLAARINSDLLIGSFDLDVDTGELRFRTSAEFPDGLVDEVQLDHLIGFNLVTMDRYLPLIDAVVDGTSAADAWSADREGSPSES